MKAENVIDYVNEYQYSFRERPFSEVDSLVLSQIVYFKMKGLIPTLGRLCAFFGFDGGKKSQKAFPGQTVSKG